MLLPNCRMPACATLESFAWACAPVSNPPQHILNWVYAGKPEQWTTLFQVLAATAHAQLDTLYSGLQGTQEAIPYRSVSSEWCIIAACRYLPVYFQPYGPFKED